MSVSRQTGVTPREENPDEDYAAWMAWQADERDEAATELAEKWWPRRYLGDLSVVAWRRVYAALDGGADAP